MPPLKHTPIHSIRIDPACIGCSLCGLIAPGYFAIDESPLLSSDRNIVIQQPTSAEGSAQCAEAMRHCPTGAIRARHFTDQQILSQIKGIMSTEMTEV